MSYLSQTTKNLLSRRAMLASLGAFGVVSACGNRESRPIAEGLLDLSDQEARLGGARIGVFAKDLGTGDSLIHRADERFAMCSTFKWVLAGMILAEADKGSFRLEDEIRFDETSLVPYSPFTEKRVTTGKSTVSDLCMAAVTISDNTAANLLLRLIDGPPGFTDRCHAWGDTITRLDRWEPEMNENAPGDARDTTSPRAMAGLLERVAFGDGLAPTSQNQLRAWMADSTTGRNRLRAALPDGWTAGDKTGTSMNGAVNDVAFFLPPGGVPILVACYINAPDTDLVGIRDRNAMANQVHAEIGAMVIDLLG